MDALRAPWKARLVAVALVVTCLALPRAAHADWQRGVAYSAYTAGAYSAPASDASLQRLAQDGNSDVSIVVTVYMPSRFSSTVAPAASTPTDASILHAMQTARSLGLRVALKPQIDLPLGGWRGAISPIDPAAWFSNYESTIDHYADLARQGGASLYEVGTELKSMSGPAYTARWQQLIADVRQRFPGQLTYAANYDEFQQIGFWRSLDYIGVDAYWPVASSSDQPVSSLVSAWSSRGYIASLQRAAAAADRPVLFTEIGYRSVVGATVHPGIWWSVASYDMQEQANAYEAVYEALASQPWFAGLYWWGWPAALPPNGWNGDYAPTFKPAESVLTGWNARLAPVGDPAAPAPALDSTAPSTTMAPAPAAKRHHRTKRGRAHRRRRTGCARRRPHSLRCRVP